MRSRILVAAMFGVILAMIPAAASAGDESPKEGILLRVNGDAALGVEESTGAVIVVRGDALIEGHADTVIVVDGVASLQGATVSTLVVVSGEAILGEGTTVSGDIWLTSATLTQSPDATVGGSVRRDVSGGLIVGLWVVGIILGIGLGLLAIVGALTFAAVAPRVAKSAGAAIQDDFGQVVLAGLVLWIAVPILAAIAAITVIGLPIAFATWFGLLPVLGFLGYLVSGIWLGGLIVTRYRDAAHPYVPALAGVGILVLTGIVPGFGWVVGTLASLLGGSALALVAWRSFRSDDVIPNPEVSNA